MYDYYRVASKHFHIYTKNVRLAPGLVYGTTCTIHPVRMMFKGWSDVRWSVSIGI